MTKYANTTYFLSIVKMAIMFFYLMQRERVLPVQITNSPQIVNCITPAL